MALKLYNTLARRLEEFIPLRETVGIYTCGLTVQGYPHIGHMRSFMSRDVLVRWLEHLGHRVNVFENFTDIDDKIIEKQKEYHIDWRRIADDNITKYLWACDRLNIRRATFYPRATQHIEEIIALVEKLVEKGYAYEKQGDVYFRVRRFNDYGRLSGKSIDELIAGARIDPSERKDDPLDFALWKNFKPGEPYWLSPWGKGRPGWHIECSAMSMLHLGTTFDIHTGGEDLVFPHHENEIAQSVAATGDAFARYWLHTGWVTLTGEKMSKSTGHFYLIEDLLKDYAPNIIRLYLIKTHYRSQIDFSTDRLDEARSAYLRIQTFIHGFKELPVVAKPLYLEEFTEAMNDDLNTSRALAVIFNLINKGYEDKDPDPAIASSVKFYLAILGFMDDKPKEPFDELMTIYKDVRCKLEESNRKDLYDTAAASFFRRLDTVRGLDDIFPSLVHTLLTIRTQLRKDKDYTLADFIRQALGAHKIQVLDKDAAASDYRLEVT
jgi:cysteinyl-tRNA synthetase